MGRHDRLFSAVAGGLQAFYTLSGHDQLARRVKPSSRRPGRTQTLAETEEATGPAVPPGDEGASQI